MANFNQSIIMQPNTNSKEPLVKKINITLDNKEYPITIQGSEEIACLCIGIGTLMQRTLSDKFKELVTLYSCDLYWIETHSLENPHNLTINKIIDDIFRVIELLRLKNLILLAHSVFGIIALEAAKRSHPAIKGVIMVGSPPAWNNHVIQYANDYFEKHASLERKNNDKIRKENFLKIKKPIESEVSLNAYEANSARYWADFNISRQFLEELWKDIEVDDKICAHLFDTLLPNHDLVINIDKISIPVILFGGKLDYDCVPLELWKAHPKPSNFTIIDCGNTSHWPHFENSALFDAAIENWIKI
jgi:pimeloyl-ACP methyl ester carboxylesterase